VSGPGPLSSDARVEEEDHIAGGGDGAASRNVVSMGEERTPREMGTTRLAAASATKERKRT
jgi:hypothetical protein